MSTINAYCGECGTFTPVPGTENCICPQCGHKIKMPKELPDLSLDAQFLLNSFKGKLAEENLLSNCFFDEDIVSTAIIIPAYRVKASGSVFIENAAGQHSRNKLNVDFVSGFWDKSFIRAHETHAQLKDLTFCFNEELIDLSSTQKISFPEWLTRNAAISAIEVVEFPDKETFFAEEGILNRIRGVALQSLDEQQVSKIETHVDTIEMISWYRYLYTAKIAINGQEFATMLFPETENVFFDSKLQKD